MDVPAALRSARRRSGLSQAALAKRAGTSQATLSAYERGRKRPSVATLARLLAAAGVRLVVEPATTVVLEPSRVRLERNARTLVEVLDLAESLPARHAPDLRFPRLPAT